MTLTDKACKAAKSTDKMQTIAAGNALYLMVPPRGSKWWRYAFRFEGRQQTISLGVYPEVSLAEARDKAIDAKRLLKEGKRPVGSSGKAARSSAPGGGGPRPFDEVAAKWLETRRPSSVMTFARDARMVSYLVNGKGAAKGFGKIA